MNREMLSIGLIGGGGISDAHARAALSLPGVEIAAVYGENEAKVRRLAQRYGGTAYLSLDAFLDHRAMDMVAIGSPSGLHAEHGIAAARRGIHVLVEKPIDISTARADALIEACDAAAVKLGVFFQDRFAPDVRRLRDLIESGRLGKPFLASARVKWYRPPEYYSRSRWRGTTDLDGGGALMNQGIHTVDLLLWLLGDVRQVSATAVTAVHEIEVEDTVVATLEFRNGAIGTLEAATSVYPGYPRRLEITGSAGTVILEHDRLIAVDLRQPVEEIPSCDSSDANASATSPVVADVRGHQRVMQDFLDAIRENRRPRCDGLEARRSVELVEAVYASCRSGRPVSIPPPKLSSGPQAD